MTDWRPGAGAAGVSAAGAPAAGVSAAGVSAAGVSAAGVSAAGAPAAGAIEDAPAALTRGLPARQVPDRSPALRYERIALVDLLDRLLAGGVVISGDVRLSIADVDLVNVSLRALISSVTSLYEHGDNS